MNTPRAGIGKVGTFIVTPRGFEPDGWQFVFAGDIPEMVAMYEPEYGQIAGWTLAALHGVAHGTPCIGGGACPLPTE